MSTLSNRLARLQATGHIDRLDYGAPAVYLGGANGDSTGGNAYWGACAIVMATSVTVGVAICNSDGQAFDWGIFPAAANPTNAEVSAGAGAVAFGTLYDAETSTYISGGRRWTESLPQTVTAGTSYKLVVVTAYNNVEFPIVSRCETTFTTPATGIVADYTSNTQVTLTAGSTSGIEANDLVRSRFSSTISSITRSGTTATVTTTAAHNGAVNDKALIQGSGVAEYDGTWNIASTTNSTTFTFALPSAAGGTANAGTVVARPQYYVAGVTSNTITATVNTSQGAPAFKNLSGQVLEVIKPATLTPSEYRKILIPAIVLRQDAVTPAKAICDTYGVSLATYEGGSSQGYALPRQSPYGPVFDGYNSVAVGKRFPELAYFMLSEDADNQNLQRSFLRHMANAGVALFTWFKHQGISKNQLITNASLFSINRWVSLTDIKKGIENAIAALNGRATKQALLPSLPNQLIEVYSDPGISPYTVATLLDASGSNVVNGDPVTYEVLDDGGEERFGILNGTNLALIDAVGINWAGSYFYNVILASSTGADHLYGLGNIYVQVGNPGFVDLDDPSHDHPGGTGLLTQDGSNPYHFAWSNNGTTYASVYKDSFGIGDWSPDAILRVEFVASTDDPESDGTIYIQRYNGSIWVQGSTGGVPKWNIETQTAGSAYRVTVTEPNLLRFVAYWKNTTGAVISEADIRVHFQRGNGPPPTYVPAATPPVVTKIKNFHIGYVG